MQFADMPPLPEEGVVREELVDAIAPALAKNHAERYTAFFEIYLEDCEPSGKHDLHVALLSSLEGPRCFKKQSNSMMISLLTHIGRHKLWETDEEMWAVIKSPMEILLDGSWKENHAAGFDRASWLATNY